MSTIGDVLKAVKDVLLIQSQVERMEEQISNERIRLDKFVDTVTDMDKRLFAIEKVIDLGSRRPSQPRIESE